MISLNIHKSVDGTYATTAALIPAEKRDLPDGNAMAAFAWDMFANTHQTVSGEPINTTIALQHVTVYAAVFAIASAVASMPLLLFKRIAKGREEAINDPLYRALTVAPNSDMNAKDMWFALVMHLALQGNGYAEILRNKAGDPVGFYPLDPRVTEPVRLPNKQLAYKTTVGTQSGAFRIINAADMLHFKFMSWDGLRGLSPIDQARNSVSLAISAEKHGAKFFGNNSVPPALLTPVGDVSEEDLADMRTFWERAQGATNQGRIGVLPSDWKLTQLAITPEQSQFLETQQLSRTNIAALFNISPSRVGDMQKQSKASGEEEQLSFVADTLQPYMTVIETEIQRKVLPEDNSMFVEFDDSTRMRGNFAGTMQGIAVGRQWGVLNEDESRAMLKLNPSGTPESTIRWAPVNMTNAANLAAPAADPTPEPLLDPPTGDPQQRGLFDAHMPILSRMSQDVIGRASQRSKRDAESLTPIFAPLMESVIDIATQEARQQFKLPADWQPSDKIAKDYIKAAASRSTVWTEENRNQSASQELYKAIQTIHISVFRDAGAAVALRSSKHE